jgi:riboflavin synthase
LFSGIVAEVGKVRGMMRKAGTVTFEVEAPSVVQDLKPGESIAVNGVCQTVTETGNDTFSFDSVVQTLKSTNLSQLTFGSEVNLEPALRLGDRISGHLVSGHIDATGVVRSRRSAGFRNVDFTLQVPDRLRRYIHDKGSLCLDGVSLTVKAVRGPVVEITVVPYTLDTTIIRAWRPGSLVNVEVDQIAKYLAPEPRGQGGGME